MPDELTEDCESPEAQIAEHVVETWFVGLTENAKGHISDHDLNALRKGILDGLKGEVLIRQPASAVAEPMNGHPEN